MTMAGRVSVERFRQRLFTSDQCQVVIPWCIVFGSQVLASSAWGSVRSVHVYFQSVVVAGDLHSRRHRDQRQSIFESSVAQPSTPIRMPTKRGGLATAFSSWVAHCCRLRSAPALCRRALDYGSRGLRRLVAGACLRRASVTELHGAAGE